MIVLSEEGKYIWHRYLVIWHRYLVICHRLGLFDLGEMATEWTILTKFNHAFVIDADGESQFVEECYRPRSQKQVI